MKYKINVEFWHKHNIGNNADFNRTWVMNAKCKNTLIAKTNKELDKMLKDISYGDNSYKTKITIDKNEKGV